MGNRGLAWLSASVSAQNVADLVLKPSAVDAMKQSLVDDRKTDMVAVGGGEITTERTDSRHGTRLGVDVSAGERALHAAAEGAVAPGDGQCLVEVVIDDGVAEGIAQEAHLQLRADIVVEREPRAVGKLIVGRVESYLADELADDRPGVSCRCRAVARGGCYLIKHRLGVEVVALFEHAHEYLVDGVETADDAVGVLWFASLAEDTRHDDARLAQLSTEAVHEQILAADEQRRERRVVVVPAPSFAEAVAVLHGQVGIDIAADGVHAHFAQCLYKSPQVVAIEPWVEAAHAIDIAMQHTGVYFARIAQFGLKLVAAAETVQGCDGGDDLQRGGGAKELPLIVAVDGRVGIEVIDHQSHLGSLEHVVAEQRVDSRLHVSRPGQCVVFYHC